VTSAQSRALGPPSPPVPVRERLQARSTLVLAVVTAVLVLAVIALILVTAQANREKAGALTQMKSMQTNASNLGETNRSLQAENKRLAAENDRLRSQSPSAAPGQLQAPPAPPAGTMLAGYAISLSAGNGVGLDVKAPGAADITTSPNAELSYHGQISSPFDIAILPPNTVPTYDLCRSQTTFVKTTPPADQGMAFCVFKRNVSVVGVAVLAARPASNAVTMSVTVWQS
jgi:hypothetical protein